MKYKRETIDGYCQFLTFNGDTFDLSVKLENYNPEGYYFSGQPETKVSYDFWKDIDTCESWERIY